MGFAVVINTNCLGADATKASGASSRNPTYANRAWMLRQVILPWYHALGCFEHIIVAGEFEPGPYHTYVPVTPQTHDVFDMLAQRQAGVEATMGRSHDWVLFQSDDHLWASENLRPVSEVVPFPVLAPSRWTRARNGFGESVNDGGGIYLTGHGLLMQRWVTALCPWTTVPHEWPLDHAFTRHLESKGVLWHYAPQYRIYDVEVGATPWA